MVTPVLTPEAEKLFAARPKTVRAIAEALAAKKGRFIQLALETWSTSHSAPLGVSIKWPDGAHQPAFIGQVRFEHGLDLGERPWEEIWWLYTGCGGFGHGGYEYQFVIWSADVPEAAAEWRDRIAPQQEAHDRHQAVIRSIEEKVAKAAAETWAAHREELKVVEDKAGKERNDFEKWRDGQLGMP